MICIYTTTALAQTIYPTLTGANKLVVGLFHSSAFGQWQLVEVLYPTTSMTNFGQSMTVSSIVIPTRSNDSLTSSINTTYLVLAAGAPGDDVSGGFQSGATICTIICLSVYIFAKELFSTDYSLSPSPTDSSALPPLPPAASVPPKSASSSSFSNERHRYRSLGPESVTEIFRLLVKKKKKPWNNAINTSGHQLSALPSRLSRVGTRTESLNHHHTMTSNILHTIEEHEEDDDEFVDEDIDRRAEDINIAVRKQTLKSNIDASFCML
eukprot:scaffold32_cov132-Ochromonas_danica.AAC.2